MKIGIIGGGRVGSCLAGYLVKQEALVGITASTAQNSLALAQAFGTAPCTNAELLAKAQILLLTVPDRLISQVAEELASTCSSKDLMGKVVLHCSGSLGLEPLATLGQAGAHVGSMHPLQSFAGGQTCLKGVYMAVDGDAEALATAEKLALALGGHPFHVSAEERAAYHAAACICSNYAVTVEALAQGLMSRWIGSREAAWQALLPLFKGTATNLTTASHAGSVLTGPIARGDVGTVAKHLAVLPEDLQKIYRVLGRVTVQVALENSTIDAKTATELERLLH
ncbi:Rossmann-like and DUF2520 domain-containing protein [Phascolarctobacterium sp.]|uniref:Rossmann-like and DUF2520 domain-containing protein n=1 Tax=Phascolarctobacterium sp. TaxID=2049039 RepID=UPI00386A90C6